MYLEQLFLCDSSLQLITPKEWIKEIKGVSTPSYLREETLIFAKDQRFYKKITDCIDNIPASMGIIVENGLWEEIKDKDCLSQKFSFVAICADLTFLMTRVSKIIHDEKNAKLDFFVDGRSSQKVSLGKNCDIGSNVFIGENVSIGNDVRIHPGTVVMPEVSIGNRCEIFPNVTLYNFTKIGENCRIHAGTTVGSDGFGYNFYNGEHRKLWHTGGVIIEDDVEIGANSCVDMGTFTPTIIRKGSKLDNQVQIAHNVDLGQGTIMCGQSGIAGSVNVGAYTVFGGQTGVTHDINIGAQCQVGGFSAVISSLKENSKVAGIPARPIHEWLAGLAYVRRNSVKKR